MRDVWLWCALCIGCSHAAGCNSLTCGPGTIEATDSTGQRRCVPTAADAPTIPCDVDGGAGIVAGRCVSAIRCGPSTVLDPASGLCVASGTTTGPSCPPPASGKMCVMGTVRHLVDGTPINGEKVKLSAYAPTALLSPGTPPVVPPLDPVVGATFTLPDLDPNATGGKLLLMVGDASGVSTPVMMNVASIAKQVSAGQIYTVDAYVLTRSQAATWSQQIGGTTDIVRDGAFVARFFADVIADPTQYTATDKLPVKDVALHGSAGTPANTFYFGADLMTIEKTLAGTSTQAGSAIVVGASFDTYTGAGGVDPASMAPIAWPGLLGDSLAGAILVQRFHPMQ
jgi:hypothetical protein